MIKDHEEDEFIAVRVQDPRVQNEGSWNSYVDFKIFLHTNSKAFTAKTSCVRRRYSEFVWLKKKLQKNTGLVPVPELPTKSFFSFSNEDFLEKRRKGLQSFLDKVLHMTVCLSDSQLHLFLQTQLPVGHILDCVHGHTPYTVTEAILTYASSNRGWTQEEGVVQEPSSQTAVSYESMESPAPHLPILQGEPLSAVTLTSTDPNELLADIHDIDTVELQFKGTETPFLNGVQDQEDNHGEEAVLGRPGPVETPLLGDSQRTNLEDVIQQVDCPCQQQTPVEVHCEADAGLEEEEYVVLVEEESHIDTTTETVPLTLSTPGPVPLTLSTPGPVPLTLSTPGPVPLTLSIPEPDSRRETTQIEVSCGAIDLGEVEVQVRDFYEETAQDEDGSREAVTEVVSHLEVEVQEGDSNVETAQVGDSPGEAVLWQDSQVDEAQDDHSDVETIQDEEDASLFKEAREGDRQDEDIPGEAVLEDVSQADEALEDNSQVETVPEEDHVKGTAMERQDSLEYMNNRDFYREICYEEEDQEDTAQDVEHSDDDDTTQEVNCNDVTNQEVEHSDHVTQEVEVIDDTTQEKETPLDSAQPIGGQLDPAQEAERDEDISSVEDCDQEKDLGGEERLAEVSPDRGSHDNSDIEVANHVETIQETNGYMETTTEEIYSTGNTEEVDLCNTDTLLPKTHEGPAHEDRFPEVSDTEGTNGVEEDIPYMTNSCAVKTPESVPSSGLDGGGDDVGQNDQKNPESNHFESLSSGVHCSEEGILEPDTDDIEDSIEDNVTQKNVP